MHACALACIFRRSIEPASRNILRPTSAPSPALSPLYPRPISAGVGARAARGGDAAEAAPDPRARAADHHATVAAR
eukprot:scaffold16286_cov61-Phaeocystis_antarctica.AAC.1